MAQERRFSSLLKVAIADNGATRGEKSERKKFPEKIVGVIMWVYGCTLKGKKKWAWQQIMSSIGGPTDDTHWLEVIELC